MTKSNCGAKPLPEKRASFKFPLCSYEQWLLKNVMAAEFAEMKKIIKSERKETHAKRAA